MPKYVELQSLLAGLPRSGTMTTSAARNLANDILSACDDVDPLEEESEWERAAAQQSREMAAEAQRGPTVVVGNINPGALASLIGEAVGSIGLSVRVPSPHHFQVMRGRQVFAEWWPSRGTTRARGEDGPKCPDEARFVKWLRTLV